MAGEAPACEKIALMSADMAALTVEPGGAPGFRPEFLKHNLASMFTPWSLQADQGATCCNQCTKNFYFYQHDACQIIA